MTLSLSMVTIAWNNEQFTFPFYSGGEGPSTSVSDDTSDEHNCSSEEGGEGQNVQQHLQRCDGACEV